MTYTSRLPPRRHQVEALSKSRGLREFGFVMDFGTGKSKCPLDEFGELEEAGEVSDLLVFAPAGCYTNWVLDKSETQLAEVKKNFSDELYERTALGWWKSGAGVTHKRGLERLLGVRDRPRVLVVNIEAVSSVKAARELCTEFLSPGRGMVVVDESAVIKGHESERTGFVVELGKQARYRRILTGIMTPDSPLDLYSQFEFLSWRILRQRSFYGFRARYAVTKKIKRLVPDKRRPGEMRELSTEIVVGYRNEAELSDLIAPYTHRVLKEECLDLPPKVYSTRDVELTAEQARIYRQFKEEAQAQLDSGDWVSSQFPMTKVMKLHQVLCGHVRSEAGDEVPVSTNRVKVLLDLLGEHTGKAIVWACYDYDVRHVAEALRREFGEGSVGCFWGGNRSSRVEDERRFLGDPECRFMVATPAAGGRGNTWLTPNMEVYYTNTYNLEHRLNSEDRPHRDGQTQSVAVVDLVSWGTMDEVILKALRAKLDLARVITRENFREWVI
jgi:hypothetical protein